jgi:hydroxyethylthiazole kinase-like sugar kinase family protein
MLHIPATETPAELDNVGQPKGPARDDQLERVTQFTRDLVRGNRGEMQ